jgi:hypothetical protein
MPRGAVAAMAMSALRWVTTGLGLLEQTPPDAIADHVSPSMTFSAHWSLEQAAEAMLTGDSNMSSRSSPPAPSGSSPWSTSFAAG